MVNEATGAERGRLEGWKEKGWGEYLRLLFSKRRLTKAIDTAFRGTPVSLYDSGLRIKAERFENLSAVLSTGLIAGGVATLLSFPPTAVLLAIFSGMAVGTSGELYRRIRLLNLLFEKP